MMKFILAGFLTTASIALGSVNAFAQEPEGQQLPDSSHQLVLPQGGDAPEASLGQPSQPEQMQQQAPSGQPQPRSNQPSAGVSPSSKGSQFEGGEQMFSGFIDPFDYAPSGRRDPFVQPIPDKPMEQGNVAGPLLPLQKFELGQLRLVGIIWDVKRPKAMIKDPGGITHVVGPNTKVGPRNGYIAVIREGEMVVVETNEQDGRLVSSAQVVKIAK